MAQQTILSILEDVHIGAQSAVTHYSNTKEDTFEHACLSTSDALTALIERLNTATWDAGTGEGLTYMRETLIALEGSSSCVREYYARMASYSLPGAMARVCGLLVLPRHRQYFRDHALEACIALVTAYAEVTQQKSATLAFHPAANNRLPDPPRHGHANWHHRYTQK